MSDNSFLYKLDAVEFQFQNSETAEKQFKLGPLNFEIPKGKLTSILGRSGSGKTTLLSLIGLLREHGQGNISVNIGGNIENAQQIWKNTKYLETFRANNIGFALQKGELLPYLSMYDNAALVLRFLGFSEKEIEERLTKHFSKLYAHEQDQQQLKKIMESKPSNVSQGQYQRGAIVRALAVDPAIILADEPTGNLDQRTGEITMEIFRSIIESKEGENAQSVIMVTHDVLLAIAYADEIITLKNGLRSAQLSKVSEDEWKDEHGTKMSISRLKENIINTYL